MASIEDLATALLLLLAAGCGSSEPAKSAASSSGGGGSSGDTTGSAGGSNAAGAAGSGAAAGAAAGSGNTGGADIPLNPTVLACDKLASPGTWERIGPAPSFVQGKETVSVAVDPNSAGTLYSGVSQAGLWKSTDCGATWVKIDTGRNMAPIDSGIQWQIVVDPINSDVYVDSGYGGTGLYRSSNGGVDFDIITPTGPGIPGFVQGFSLDPKDHKHILVGFHENCTGAYAPMCFAETTDGATSWRFIVGPSKAWEEAAGAVILDGSTWLYAAPFDGLYYTANAGVTWERVVGSPGCYADFTLVAGNYYVGCLNGVIQSPDAHAWKLLDKSPRATAVLHVGMTLFTSYQNDNTGQPVWTAPVSDPTAWTQIKTPTITQGASASNLRYDTAHHVLYMASWGGGLWRGIAN